MILFPIGGILRHLGRCPHRSFCLSRIAGRWDKGHAGRYFVGDFGAYHYIHVYAVRPKGGGCIKFGRALDVKKRFSSIQCGSPFKLEIMGSVYVPEDVETEIHAYLKADLSHGEWFLPTVLVTTVADYIAKGDAYALVKELGLYKLLPISEADQSNYDYRMANGPRRR